MKGKKVWIMAITLTIAIFVGGLFTGRSIVSAKVDQNKFHGDVAHALLEMHESLDIIAKYHAKGTMPENKDELHEKVAHGFKHALELWGVKYQMPH